MAETIKLAVVADDLGYSEPRDAGIFMAFKSGIVTDGSVMVNGKSARSAIAEAKRCNFPLGLHLNLTEGFPISSVDSVSSLVDEKTGAMLGKHGFRDALRRGDVFLSHLRLEVMAQLQEFEKLVGHYPDRLDGHQHVHVLPGVFECVLLALSEVSPGAYVRVPERSAVAEGGWIWDRVGEERQMFYEEVSLDARRCRSKLEHAGFRSSEAFVGFVVGGVDCTASLLQTTLEAVGRGCRSVELMLHPGWRTTAETVAEMHMPPLDVEEAEMRMATLAGCGLGVDDFAADGARETELRAATHPGLRRFLRDSKFSLSGTAQIGKIQQTEDFFEAGGEIERDFEGDMEQYFEGDGRIEKTDNNNNTLEVDPLNEWIAIEPFRDMEHAIQEADTWTSPAKKPSPSSSIARKIDFLPSSPPKSSKIDSPPSSKKSSKIESSSEKRSTPITPPRSATKRLPPRTPGSRRTPIEERYRPWSAIADRAIEAERARFRKSIGLQ